MKEKFNPIIYTDTDNLYASEIGEWALEKYKLLGHYANIFTSSMKYKWNLVYLDLFAGSGYAQIEENKKIVYSSSLISLSLPNKFHNYIFCEKDTQRFDALSFRVTRDFPNTNIQLLNIDSNENIDLILNHLPKENLTKNLIFAFVDPYSLNLKFETLRKLSENKRIDFLILLALQMDGRRNFVNYLNEENSKIDLFLGKNNWRNEVDVERPKEFIRFLSNQYDNQMKSINYLTPPQKDEIKTKNNLSLYYMAFYSKHPLGNEFYKKIKKSSSNQLGLDL